MSVARGLAETAALLAQGFCRGTLARDERGQAVDPEDPRARSWCVLGATIRACGRTDLCELVVVAIKRRLGHEIHPHPRGGYYTDGLAPVSDSLDQAGAVELVRQALANLR